MFILARTRVMLINIICLASVMIMCLLSRHNYQVGLINAGSYNVLYYNYMTVVNYRRVLVLLLVSCCVYVAPGIFCSTHNTKHFSVLQ